MRSAEKRSRGNLLRTGVTGRRFMLVVPLLLALLWGTAGGYELRLVNTSERQLSDHPVTVALNGLPPRLQSYDVAVTDPAGEPLASQMDDLDGDGTPDELVVKLDFAPLGAATLVLQESKAAGTQRRKLYGEELPAALGYDPNLENRWLRWTPKGNNAFEVQDRKLEEAMLDLSLDWDSPFKVERGRLRVAAGPLRSVGIRQGEVWAEAEGGPHFRETQRFIMYKDRRRVDIGIEVTNVGDSTRGLPGGMAFDGLMGDTLVKDLPEVVLIHDERARYEAIYAVSGAVRREYDDSPRLWLNPVTERGLAYLPHGREGGSARFFGVDVYRFNPSPGNKLLIEGLRGSLKPGQTKSFYMSFVLYEGEAEESIEQYRADLDQIKFPGVVAVFDLQSRRILQAAGAPLYIMDGFAGAERWLAEGGVDLQVGTDGARITAQRPGSGVCTSFARDFSQPTELRGELAEGALEVEVENSQTGEVATVGPVSGTFKLDLGEALPYEGSVRGVLRLKPVAAEGAASGRLSARVEELTLGWPRPDTPELIWPKQGQPLSDLGVSFTIMDPRGERWRGEKPRSYELVVARDKGFRRVVLHEKIAPDRDLKGREGMTEYLPKQLLPKGTYYWKVRALERGGQSDWTDARTFTVDSTEHSRAPLVRPISPSRPAAILRGSGEGEARHEFMRKLRERHGQEITTVPVAQLNYNPGEEYSYPFLINSPRQVCMPRLEHAYRNEPQAIGVLLREAGFDRAYLKRLLLLCGKYGRYVSSLNIEKDFMQRSALNKDFYPIMKDYGIYLWPQHKWNNNREPMTRPVAEAGAYLPGRVGLWGTETEWGYAWKAMFPGERWDAQCRAINWMPPWVVGLAMGATSYRVENFGNGKPHRPFGVLSNDGRLGPLWYRAMGPFLVDMLEYDLIPTRRQMLDKLKVVLAGNENYFKRPSTPDPNYPGRVVAALHGLPLVGMPRTHIFENQWIPDSSAFYFVPILPSYLPKNEARLFEHILDAESLDHPEQAVEYARQFYPPEPEDNEAYSVLVGDTGVVINTVDRRDDPRSGPQQFRLNLAKGPLESIGGEVDWQAYVIMKQMKDSLFIHSNNFWTNYTHLSLKSRSGQEPEVEVTPASALRARSWDPASGELSLILSHHEGVTRATVTSQ